MNKPESIFDYSWNRVIENFSALCLQLGYILGVALFGAFLGYILDNGITACLLGAACGLVFVIPGLDFKKLKIKYYEIEPHVEIISTSGIVVIENPWHKTFKWKIIDVENDQVLTKGLCRDERLTIDLNSSKQMHFYCFLHRFDKIQVSLIELPSHRETWERVKAKTDERKPRTKLSDRPLIKKIIESTSFSILSFFVKIIINLLEILLGSLYFCACLILGVVISIEILGDTFLGNWLAGLIGVLIVMLYFWLRFKEFKE